MSTWQSRLRLHPAGLLAHRLIACGVLHNLQCISLELYLLPIKQPLQKHTGQQQQQLEFLNGPGALVRCSPGDDS
jgi:hypothetical protein